MASSGNCVTLKGGGLRFCYDIHKPYKFRYEGGKGRSNIQILALRNLWAKPNLRVHQDLLAINFEKTLIQ